MDLIDRDEFLKLWDNCAAASCPLVVFVDVDRAGFGYYSACGMASMQDLVATGKAPAGFLEIPQACAVVFLPMEGTLRAQSPIVEPTNENILAVINSVS